jgi:ATP-dependent helicase/nuclease subunit A
LKQVASNWQLNAEQSQTAHRWALAVTQGEGAWAWDEQCVGFAGNEVEMTVAGALMRLDRLVFRRDTQQWWVLDFKSSQSPQHDAALLEQLNTYRNAVALMYPTHTVRAAFLTSVGALIEPHSAHAEPS